MRLFLSGSLMLLAGCSTPQGFHIPDELLSGCYVTEKPVVSLVGAVEAYSDAVGALACANGRIEAIADIYHGADK